VKEDLPNNYGCGGVFLCDLLAVH